MGLFRLLRLILVTCALTCLVACGAHDVVETDVETASEDALANCDASAATIALDVRTYGSQPTLLYKDPALVEGARAVRAGEVVFHDPRDPRMQSAHARKNDSIVVRLRGGAEGWLAMAAVRVRAPEGGVCKDGRDPAAGASAALRIASEDSLPLALARGAVSCGLGLGEGVVEGGAGLIELVATALSLAPAAARELFALNADVFFAALGRADAADRLRQRAATAVERAEAVAAAIMHAIPTLQKSMNEGYAYYRMLDAEQQSRMLCRIIGRLSFDVLLGLGVSFVAKEGVALAARVATAHLDALRGAQIAGRTGSVVDLRILAQVTADRERAQSFGPMWAGRVERERAVQAQWMAQFDDQIAGALDTSRSAEARLQAMDRISDASNPPNRIAGPGTAYPNHNGNCAFAAFTMLATLVTGRPQCALPYFDDTHFSNGMFSELAMWKLAEPAFSGAEDVVRLASTMRENEVAILFSRAWQGDRELSAHATVLVKLEGRVYNVNNQGWFAHEPIEGWLQRWSSRGYSRVQFGISRGDAQLAAAP